MSRYALVVDNVVNEIIECDEIEKRYHPDIVKMMVKCDDAVSVGMAYDGKKFCEPAQTENSIDLVAEQYSAIDAHIQTCIKSRGFDDIGQVALCCVDGNGYQVEALAVSTWVRKCWYIQEQIKSSDLKFDSVEDAINELPAFDIAH